MVCGKAIDEYLPRTQRYCSDKNCMWKYFDRIRRQIRDSRENLKHKRENLNQKVYELQSDAAKTAGIKNPEDFKPVAIPINVRNIRPLPEKRRLVFCERLKQLIDQAATKQRSSTNLTNDSAKRKKYDARMQSTELRSILNNACAICKGSCCLHGEDHAYLQVDTLLDYMNQHPDFQQNQVFDEYLFYLPNKTYEDSCVYHTELGCALPQYMRSESCDLFACDGLAEIEEHAINTKSTSFFIAAMEGKNVLRSVFIEANQIRGHHIYS